MMAVTKTTQPNRKHFNTPWSLIQNSNIHIYLVKKDQQITEPHRGTQVIKYMTNTVCKLLATGQNHF